MPTTPPGPPRRRIAVHVSVVVEGRHEGWQLVQIPARGEDPHSALVAYLTEQFGRDAVRAESRDGIFTIVDPDVPDGTVVRFYRV